MHPYFAPLAQETPEYQRVAEATPFEEYTEAFARAQSGRTILLGLENVEWIKQLHAWGCWWIKGDAFLVETIYLPVWLVDGEMRVAGKYLFPEEFKKRTSTI